MATFNDDDSLAIVLAVTTCCLNLYLHHKCGNSENAHGSFWKALANNLFCNLGMKTLVFSDVS